MKITALFLIFYTFASLSVSAHGDKTIEKSMFKGTDTAAAKVVLAFHKALKTKDVALARAQLADDVAIFEGGRVERSAEEYAQHHMLSDMKYLAAMHSTPLEHQVQVFGDTAISISRSHTTGSYKDKKRDYQGMETMFLVKQQGEWKIKHIHWSH